jgi:hypothetical protein
MANFDFTPFYRSMIGFDRMAFGVIRQKLAELQSEHRDMDDVISRIIGGRASDQLQIQRLKKRKLMLKDQISQLENQLVPNIIA